VSGGNIFELRQYTLKPGRRDDLIGLFEREFVESQEVLGMGLPGTFRDADRPDRFVWLRGFPDMESRARSLAAFYGGEVWKANRNAANETMIDSDNVLLLKPAWGGARFPEGGTRAALGASGSARGLVVGTIYNFEQHVPPEFIGEFRKAIPSLYAAPGTKPVAALVTENSPNNFPALPVREGEHVFIWFVLFADSAAQAHPQSLPDELSRFMHRPIEVLKLIPTARSLLHA